MTHFGQRQQFCLGMQDCAASAGDPMKLALIKGNYFALKAGLCCLCRRPDETHCGQRQLFCLGMQDCAASARDPMNLTLVKGSKFALEGRIVLPLPETR